MKILFVQRTGGVSGSELYLMQLLPELKKRGYEVELLIGYKVDNGRNKPLVKKMEAFGIPVYEMYGCGPYSIKFMSWVRKIIKKGKYDLVQSNLIHADLFLSTLKFFFFRKMKLVSVKHGFNEEYAAKYGFDTKKVNRSLYTWVQRGSGLMINRNISISKGVRDLYVKGKITKPKKMGIVYYGINLDYIPSSGYTNNDTRRYAIILGRLVKYKGHELVIKAWTNVKEYDPSLQLYIVGDGIYRPQLEKLVSELGLTEQVRFLGHQSNPHSLLHFAEFSLVPSVFEGFGLITLESWYHKKPVVAFDVPALNEAVDDGKTGLIVTPFDTNELGEKIISLFKDPAKTKIMGENGYKKLMKDFAVERMADEMIDVYNSLVPVSAQKNPN